MRNAISIVPVNESLSDYQIKKYKLQNCKIRVPLYVGRSYAAIVYEDGTHTAFELNLKNNRISHI